MYFRHLRQTQWSPTFEWVESSIKCAHKINSYHEDYPKYVEATGRALRFTTRSVKIPNNLLLDIHRLIFSDQPFKGKWRDTDVIVGIYHPPQRLVVADLMDDLEAFCNITDIMDLIEWYKDFETIHPFQDGNGRVGGVIVAAYAHAFHPTMGWFAPNQ